MPYFGSITVDASDVEDLIESIGGALSPTGLSVFLEGPAYEYLSQRVEARFASEGDAASGDWPPLAAFTVRQRERLGYGGEHPINVRTGELWDYAVNTYQVFPAGSGAVLEMPERGAADSELARKFKTAQEGRDPNPNPSMAPVPPRPVVAFDAADAEILLEMMNEWVVVNAGKRAVRGHMRGGRWARGYMR